MSEPYLIAHVVRGEAALDVAIKMEMPLPSQFMGDTETWWIIPTSGHRAYPYWNFPLLELYSDKGTGNLSVREMIGSDQAPESWPDHYPINQPARTFAPKKSAADLLKDIGLIEPEYNGGDTPPI